jgi:formamidopyrimidine-DNA glycosylase
MPELPDITLYLDALAKRVAGRRLEAVTIVSPFLLRTVEPALTAVFGRKVVELRRIGKRIAIGLEDEFWLVVHLMIAGRLHWKARGAKPAGRVALAAFEFESGVLLLTEAGTRKQASLHVVRGEETLQALDPGGLEVLDARPEAFVAVLRRENHTLKRALTDQRLFSGIGNAYSDEILHRARLSPLLLTSRISDAEAEQLYEAVRLTLREWIARLREETGEAFPEKVTAFREGMRVHGRYKLPCPECGSAVQRIRYAANECNYCAKCQTGGKLLSDRAQARLLKQDWPRTLEEMEQRLVSQRLRASDSSS